MEKTVDLSLTPQEIRATKTVKYNISDGFNAKKCFSCFYRVVVRGCHKQTCDKLMMTVYSMPLLDKSSFVQF